MHFSYLLPVTSSHLIILRIELELGLNLFGLHATRPHNGPFMPHTLIPSHGSPGLSQQFHSAPRLRLLT